MVLIGFVLLVGAAIVGVDVAASNNFAIDVDAFGQTIATSLAGLFVAGVVTGTVAALGIMLMRDGAARRKRLRREARHAQEEQERLASAAERELQARHIDAANNGDPIDLRDGQLNRERITTF
jgi:TRAP-type C4-dicarboxylate transport system permease large subunit